MDNSILKILILFILLSIFACSVSTNNVAKQPVFEVSLVKVDNVETPTPNTAISSSPNVSKINILPNSNLAAVMATPKSSISNSSLPINNLMGIFNGLEYEEVYVSRVIDGDTIELIDGRKIRYLGIDTPETVHPRKNVECFGPEASDINKQLVLNKKVRIYKGKKDKDIYHRYLRYIVIHENEELLVNDYLVKNGYATVNRKYQSDNLNKIYEILLASEKLASSTKKGLWGACK